MSKQHTAELSLAEGFAEYWVTHRVKRVLNPAGFGRMVWEASARCQRKAYARPDLLADIAGLESAIGRLSSIVDEQRKLLADVEKECGVDGWGVEMEDGDSKIIDRVRAHLAAFAETEQEQPLPPRGLQEDVNSACRRQVWWRHNKARFTTAKQAAFAAWDAAPSPQQADKQCLDDYATEINRLRNVIQAACSGGLDHMIERWAVLFPDAPVPTLRAIPQQAERFDWSDYREITDVPSVDEAIRTFLDDQTEDNSTCLVREIVEAAGDRLLSLSAPQQAKQLPGAAVESGRYQLICANGCGRCGVRLAELEALRVETLDGTLLAQQMVPNIVSACCGQDVEVWDELAQDNMPHKLMAVTVDQLYAPSAEAEKFTWGIDWGHESDHAAASLLKRHANGTLEIVAQSLGPVVSQRR